MLIFTNRKLDATVSTAKAFTNIYTTFSPELNFADVSRISKANANWKVENQVSKVTDKDALNVLSQYLNGDKPVLVFVHGNNNTPATCFTRCKALEDQYDVAVIGFSWTSEGYQPDGSDLSGVSKLNIDNDLDEDSISSVSKDNLSEDWVHRKARRYAQAKTNAQHSAASLARFLRLVASARLATMKQPVSIAAHSLGCHFMHYTITQQGSAESLAVAQNVILLAGCTGAAKHAAWVNLIKPVQRVYITYTKSDSVLYAASIIDGDEKLGTNPGRESILGLKYRYIDFEGASKMKLGAHRYFIADDNKTLSKKATLLFKRIFSSKSDFNSSIEQPKIVYPLGCLPDGSICYMGNAQVTIDD